MTTLPQLGALPEGTGTRFRVYAPDARKVELVLETGDTAGRGVVLQRGADGVYEQLVEGAAPGARYRYRLDGGPLFPDPVSRYQPMGVHGPSEVVDPAAYAWRNVEWRGRPLAGSVFYELHVGTFTPEGTYAAAATRLEALRDLGITSIELMPLHDFPGERNWGYDGAALFAPARCHGHPDDLRRLIDRAHELGLAVLLDVVYNHLGPDGAYVAAFDRALLDRDRRTPWGAGLNLDGPRSAAVREILIQNGLYWQREFRIDGLRLDATHALLDSSVPHFLAELAERVEAAAGDRAFVLIAEDGRNLNHVLLPRGRGGYGFDGEWTFDLHHQFHRALTGEAHEYYIDFRTSARDLARALRQGWIYTGQHSRYGHGGPRGTDPSGIPPWRFVSYLQSHDEIGNRPLGDRLPALIGLPAYRAALALLLAAPQTPMLFMGDEWAATTPFLFFTDHKPTIGARVTQGRRAHFARWTGFKRPGRLDRIPDPQSPATFEASRLDWTEREREPHASMVRYVRRLLALRRAEPALRVADAPVFDASAVGRRAVMLVRRAPGARAVAVVAELAGASRVRVTARPLGERGAWEVLFTSEDSEFAGDSAPPILRESADGLEIRFERPGAVVLLA